MEKKIDAKAFFKSIDLNEVINQIVDQGRLVKDNVPVFKESGNGCILIVARPLCREADIWLGNLSRYDADGKPIDINEYVFARTIAPGGSHTIQWHSPGDGHIEPVNCFAYAMMKVAYLARLVKKGITNEEDTEANNTKFFCEDNGYSRHKGAVCTTVHLDGEPLMRLYICFSGASSEEDLQCAEAVTVSTRKYLRSYCEELEFVSRKVNGLLP